MTPLTTDMEMNCNLLKHTNSILELPQNLFNKSTIQFSHIIPICFLSLSRKASLWDLSLSFSFFTFFELRVRSYILPDVRYNKVGTTLDPLLK